MNIILVALLQALGVVVYIGVVSAIMSNGERIFGEMHGLVGPMAFLLLFTTSAAITGSLVFGRAVYLFLTGERQNGVKLVLMTIGWLAVITIIAFGFLALR